MSSTAYKEAITEKLNSGLVRLVSDRSYPVLQKGKFSKNKKMRRGAVFRIGALHRQPLTEGALKRNRRGYFNAQLNTVAHAPSLYHWLFHRCGIPFEETQMLIQTSGLRMDGALVQSLDEAEVQRPWSDWQRLRIDVRSTNPLAVQAVRAKNMNNSTRTTPMRDPDGTTIQSGSGRESMSDHMEDGTGDPGLSHAKEETMRSGTTSSAFAEKEWSGANRSEAQGEGSRGASGNGFQEWIEDEHVFVPALQRALHRRYFFQFLHPGISLSSEVEDPRSFVHRLIPSFFPSSSCETLGLNQLHPMGLITGVKGLGIVSNDVSIVRYWNNAFLGNYGVYDVRFVAGTPREVMEAAQKRLETALHESVMAQSPQALLGGEKQQTPSSSSSSTLLSSSGGPLGVIPSCRCTLERVPPASRDWIAAQHFSSSASSSPKKESNMRRTPELSSDGRLLVTTPLFPYREVKKLWRVGARITLVRSGPFSLPDDLARVSHRPLTVEELALLFAFERKLKVNRMILSLTEFDADTSKG